MIKSLKIALAGAALSLPLLTISGDNAAAQNNNLCANNVFINSVFVSGATFVDGQNRFEYSLQVQNQSAVARSVTITLSGFPRDVTLFSPSLPIQRLGSYEQQTIRFGSGTNANISLGTVSVVHDNGAGRAPFIRLTQCRPV
ncbi:hypothetical protein ACE7GA_24630 [Roseomonas sp. CCTCC AB2023176]|uniref:hypothetical protein n=1 Tax=Roseomonas sp. CCTCC AB2023176 TaxID=3342640 RepID=UPI0035E3B20E